MSACLLFGDDGVTGADWIGVKPKDAVVAQCVLVCIPQREIIVSVVFLSTVWTERPCLLIIYCPIPRSIEIGKPGAYPT
jgi:hypothetical protein